MTKINCDQHGEVELDIDEHGNRGSCGCFFTKNKLEDPWTRDSTIFPGNGWPTGRKDDNGKTRFDLVPFGPLKDIAEVLTFGLKKYAPDNWKIVPDAIPRYEAAMLRHIAAYKMGEINDTETGMSHLAHAGCCLMFLMHFTKETK